MKYISLRDFIRRVLKPRRQLKKIVSIKLKVSHFKSCLGKEKFMSRI